MVSFSTIGRANQINIKEIIDIDYGLATNRVFSGRNVPQDSLFLLLPQSSVVNNWKITTGWDNNQVSAFVQAIRGNLTARGIKTFPLLESRSYDSSITR